MELKLRLITKQKSKWQLLIAPYGIETPYDEQSKNKRYLLIAPYGIETSGEASGMPCFNVLLIAPYGIETRENRPQGQKTKLF